MANLEQALEDLRPNNEFFVNGSTVNWINIEQGFVAPTQQEIDDKITELSAIESLNAAKATKLAELSASYETRQTCNVNFSNNDFVVPLKGNSFLDAERQYFVAEAQGSADIIAVNSNYQLIRSSMNLAQWQQFHTAAKARGIDNLQIKSQKELDIALATSESSVNAIDCSTSIFPSVLQINIT